MLSHYLLATFLAQGSSWLAPTAGTHSWQRAGRSLTVESEGQAEHPGEELGEEE